ncbi:MAG: hypothetical protein HC836_38500 [Richelia sp. RM2_1_2]|nr:hypothetical protein [Richelia sp. RM2_1_2]
MSDTTQKAIAANFLLDNLVTDPVPVPEDAQKQEAPDTKTEAPVDDENQQQAATVEGKPVESNTTQDDPKVFGELAREFAKYNGLDITDEELVEIMKEDSIEGLTSFLKAVVDNSIPQLDPTVAKIQDYINEGKTIEDYFKENFINNTSYLNKDVEGMTADEKKRLIFDYQKKSTGLSDARIEKFIAALDEQDLAETAKEALTDLQQKEKAAKETQEKETKARQEQEVKQREEFQKQAIEKAQSFIDGASVIAGFELNSTQKQKFKDFLFNKSEIIPEVNPTTGKETGRKARITPYEKWQRENSNASLELAYLAFLGGNKEKISKFVDSDVSKRVLQGLSKLTSSGGDNKKGQPIEGTPDMPKPKEDKQKLISSFTLDNLAK